MTHTNYKITFWINANTKKSNKKALKTLFDEVFKAFLLVFVEQKRCNLKVSRYDNSVMESFFSNLKREELYRTKYRSENEFKAAIDKYMIFYNEQRPHAKNGYKTPLRKETDFTNS